MSTTSDPPIEPTGSRSSRRKWGILSPRNVILLLLPSFPLQHPPSNRTTRGSIFSIGKCSFSIEWRWTGLANVLSRQSSHIEWIGSWLTGWKGVVGLMDRKDNRTPHSDGDGVVQLHITMGDDDTTHVERCMSGWWIWSGFIFIALLQVQRFIDLKAPSVDTHVALFTKIVLCFHGGCIASLR